MKTPRKAPARHTCCGERHVKGSLKAGRAKFAVIVAEFNEYFTVRLLEGALDTLCRHGVPARNVTVYHAPGAFEIPLVLKRVLKKGRVDAVITLGMVIRGRTRHFKHVVDAAAQGTARASLDFDVPVIHGVVAAENHRQAVERAGGKGGNKGRDAARAALQMADLLKRI